MKITAWMDRPAKYLFADGVDELMLGCFLLSYSTAAAALSHVDHKWRDFGGGLGGMWPPLLLLLCAFGMKWGREFLRSRVTAPRGGHVVLYVKPYRRVLMMVCGFLMFTVMTVAIPLATGRLSGAVICCAIFAGVYLLSGAIFRVLYMSAIGVLFGALCFWVSRESSDLTFVMQCVGLTNAVAGAVKLWRFVRSHPIAIETEA